MAEPFALLKEIEEQSIEQCMWIITGVIDTLLADGRVYGDVLPSRADRIARLMDLAERGVLDVLQTMSPPTYEQLLADYERDVRQSPVIS